MSSFVLRPHRLHSPRVLAFWSVLLALCVVGSDVSFVQLAQAQVVGIPRVPPSTPPKMPTTTGSSVRLPPAPSGDAGDAEKPRDPAPVPADKQELTPFGSNLFIGKGVRA